MNTTKHTSQQSTSIFGSLKSLGRGIAVSSAVAVMGVGTLSAADASAAGVATGVRHASTVTSTTTGYVRRVCSCSPQVCSSSSPPRCTPSARCPT